MDKRNATKRKLKFSLALFLLLAPTIAVAVMLHFNPPQAIKLPPCVLREMTGIYCPGCGTARAARRAMVGDLAGAFRYNPLAVVMAPLTIYLLVLFYVDLWRGYTPYRRSALAVAWFCLIVLLVYSVARNIPLESFDWLRPPDGPCQ